GVRSRLDPGDPGGEPGAIHRLLFERIRHPRLARPLLPARRHGGEVPLSQHRSGGDPRVRGCEDAHPQPGPFPDLAQPHRDRRRARHHDLGVALGGQARERRHWRVDRFRGVAPYPHLRRRYLPPLRGGLILALPPPPRRCGVGTFPTPWELILALPPLRGGLILALLRLPHGWPTLGLLPRVVGEYRRRRGGGASEAS